MKGWLTIGQFSARVGLTPRALRIYETVGLIQSHVRGENGYRYYDEAQVPLAERIAHLKSLGFSLREVRAILLIDQKMDAGTLLRFFEQRLAEVSTHEKALAAQRVHLENILLTLKSNPAHLDTNERNFIMSHFEKTLPFLSVRDLVFFPGATHAVFVGRSFSIAAVQQATNEFDGHLIVATQKAAEMNDKPDAAEIFDVGCLCKILSVTNERDDSLKVTIKALARCHVVDILDAACGRQCKISEMPSPSTSHLTESDRDRVLVSLATRLQSQSELTNGLEKIADPFEFVMKAGSLLSAMKLGTGQLSKEQRAKRLFLADELSEEEKASMNLTMARVQEILSETDAVAASHKIVALVEEASESA